MGVEAPARQGARTAYREYGPNYEWNGGLGARSRAKLEPLLIAKRVEENR